MRTTTAACPAFLTVGSQTYRLRFLRGRHMIRDDGRWRSVDYHLAHRERILTLAGGMSAARLGDAMIDALGEILAEQGRDAVDLFD